MIDCKELTLKYDKCEALSKVNLHIGQKETYTIIGESGCGKTTLLYAIAGIREPSSGSIIRSHKGSLWDERACGLVLQNHGLFPWKSVWENVSLGLQVRNIDEESIDVQVKKILKKLDIYNKRHSYIKELSGGQKQRVAIARTLAMNPRLLLMDEPTASLDAMSKEKLQNLILNLYRESDMTLVFVTHDIQEAVLLGQKIIIMENGKIKKILHNLIFGEEDPRNSIDFYNMVVEVRQALEEIEW